MFKLTDCRLREIEERDLAQLLAWRNEERIRQVMYTDHVITPEEHRRWFDKIKANTAGMNSRHWLFEHQGIVLGQVNVVDIDQRHRHCHWGFYIGERSAPKGSGMVLGILVLDQIFFAMDMNRVCGEVLDFNEASIRYHKALGFQEEGCLRQQVLKQNVFYDVICFGLLRQEWTEKRTALTDRWLSVGKEERHD
jgi:UDP-4-amino-4,6-dideoxy-N-acetyl-beta-L-altrosamine N-acetyltransferase